MSDNETNGKKNILVTGGAGFIGSFLCEKLLKDDHNVICVDNFSTANTNNIDHLLQNPDFELLRADINEPLVLEDYPELDRFKINVKGIQDLYNLACPTSAKKFGNLREQTMLANSLGMHNMLDLALKYKAKFFQASSSIIYGMRPDDGHLFKEDEFGLVDHLTPRACYDEGKRWAETMVSAYRDIHGLDIRIGRIFRTYGPRMALLDGQMIPDFVMDALDGKDLVIYGDDNFRSCLIYVTDTVDAIIRLMNSSKDIGPMNIGSDYDVRLVDVANKVIEMTNSTSTVRFDPPLEFMRDLGLPDISKAKDELGWIPLVPLNQGLQKTVEFTVAHRGLISPSME